MQATPPEDTACQETDEDVPVGLQSSFTQGDADDWSQRSCFDSGLLGLLTNGTVRRLERDIQELERRLGEKDASLKVVTMEVLRQERELYQREELLQELRVTALIDKETKELLRKELEVLKTKLAAAIAAASAAAIARQDDSSTRDGPPEVTAAATAAVAPILNDVASLSSTVSPLESKLETLETLGHDLTAVLKQKDVQIQMLKNQLAALGEVPIEEALSLAEAEEKLKRCVERLLAGEEKAQADFDKYDRIIRNHPDKLAEEERLSKEWDEKNEEPNREGLRIMRSWIPADILSTSLQELKRRGLTDAQAARVWQRRALWLCRIPTERIQKMHEVDLNSRSHLGLDIVELRALYCALPASFDSDSTGKKAAWKNEIFSKLRTLVAKADTGRLTKTEKRAPCYPTPHTGATAGGKLVAVAGPFDPDAAYVVDDSLTHQRTCSTVDALSVSGVGLSISAVGGLFNATDDQLPQPQLSPSSPARSSTPRASFLGQVSDRPSSGVAHAISASLHERKKSMVVSGGTTPRHRPSAKSMASDVFSRESESTEDAVASPRSPRVKLTLPARPAVDMEATGSPVEGTDPPRSPHGAGQVSVSPRRGAPGTGGPGLMAELGAAMLKKRNKSMIPPDALT